MSKASVVALLDVSAMKYPDRLTAAALQGLVNRDGPKLFLNWGIYDDPSARRTNEVFLSDEIWYSTYRDAIGNQDLLNLEYYRSRYGISAVEINGLDAAVERFRGRIDGAVVWDPALEDTVNISLMTAARDGLLVLHPERIPWAEGRGIEIKEDLRGRWKNRIALYRWARRNLWEDCSPGKIASVEPGWKRPEFADYLVANRIFIYNLATKAGNPLFTFGQNLLFMLVAGPFSLRNFLFNLRLDGPVRRLGMFLMNLGSPETRLASRLQRAVKKKPLPTIFGWHTLRDDEFSFMVHLSANGMRLVPSHLAGNFSFHSKLPAAILFRQRHMPPESVRLEEDRVYVSFTLSDGDQLVLMSTAELGNWRRPERGKVPFNWETQPLLTEIAPALLGMYYETLSPADCLVAGPSGAGYIVPPLHPRLREYLRETASVCRKADVRVVSSYIGDPSERVVREHCEADGDFTGFLSGYVHFGRVPMYRRNNRAFVANAVPHLDHVGDDCEKTLEAVRGLIDAPGPLPRFIGVHLFAYRTTIKDVYEFTRTLDPSRVKVVRADEFLIAASKHLEKYPDMTDLTAVRL